MAITFNPMSGKFDYYLGYGELDGRYLKLNGSNSPVTGDVFFPVGGLILKDANGSNWRLTVNTDGALQTTLYVPDPGFPIGLSLGLSFIS